MTPSSQKKGAAPVRAGPRHVNSNPRKDQEMNKQSNITVSFEVPDFPVYAQEQSPDSDFETIRTKLRIVVNALSEGAAHNGLNREEAADLMTLLCEAIDTSGPVMLLLESVENLTPAYLHCRRRWILDRNAKAVA